MQFEQLQNMKGERIYMKNFIVKKPFIDPFVIEMNDIGSYIQTYLCTSSSIFSKGIYMLIEENMDFNFNIGKVSIYGTVVFVGGREKDDKSMEYRALRAYEIEEILNYFLVEEKIDLVY